MEARLDGKHEASWSWQKQPRPPGQAWPDLTHAARASGSLRVSGRRNLSWTSNARLPDRTDRQTDSFWPGQALDSNWPAAGSRGGPLSRARSALAAAGTL